MYRDPRDETIEQLRGRVAELTQELVEARNGKGAEPPFSSSKLSRTTVEESDCIMYYLRSHGVRIKGNVRINREGSKLHLEWEEP